jgi:2'-5' RNA ligase
VTEQLRSFIAVSVPPEAAVKLRTAQDRLRQADPGVKWVDPENFHVTLKFLGNVDRQLLTDLWHAVGEALNGTRRFTMRFRGLGAFPTIARPRVVWAGISDGASELTQLATRVEEACAQHGFEREERSFRAHLTLGRARHPGPSPTLASILTELAQADLGQTEVDRTLLMKSQLVRSGAVYSVLEQQPLSEGDHP